MSATKAPRRTDPHRPGALVPADYESCLDYSMATCSAATGPVPPIGVDCTWPHTLPDGRVYHGVCPDSGRCCVRSAEGRARGAGHEVFGGVGRCGVCGAHYTYGTLFRHRSGELVHMGHDCADKYRLMYDRSAWEVENGRLRAALARNVERAVHDEQRRAFLDARPGLEGALALGRSDDGATRAMRTIADVRDKFYAWRSMSDKQVELVMRLAGQILDPPPPERHCPAPVGPGRVTFTGEIVSVKAGDGYMGGVSYKMTIRVETEDGSTWLAFGTCPSSLTDILHPTSHWGGGKISELRGRVVEVTAGLALPRERRDGGDHFAFMSRPSARFADVVDHPVYRLPRCTIGEPCRVIRKQFDGLSGEWTPMICDGRCNNAAKTTKTKSTAAPRASRNSDAGASGAERDQP